MDDFKLIYMGIIDAFDKDKTAIQFLREDGEGGFRAGIYRMAREIDRLREKCGEPAQRDLNWEAEEDAKIDAAPVGRTLRQWRAIISRRVNR